MADEQPPGGNGDEAQVAETESNDRQSMPVDLEQPPRLTFPVVGIGASAGGLPAFIQFFQAMPADSGMAFVLIQHLPPDRESLVADILQTKTQMPVAQVSDGVAIEPNHVYVIRPGHTLTIKHGHLHLGEKVEKPRHSRPVDDFFKSLAEEQRERAICIILSGMGSNGTAGAQAVKAVGGICVAQDPDSAEFPSMPSHLIQAGYADYIMRPEEMPEMLRNYALHPYASRAAAGVIDTHEEQPLREILALLRTRMRHDFSGYKKATVLRRVQRRMGLHNLHHVNDYSRLLRQNPSEVVALNDDLLIHVTGFFRDEVAWESLRAQVLAPLVAERDADQPIRCWVTACSSGEEAYTLAMLLTEEAEKVDKQFEIKIFATDSAERPLNYARNGIYPGGIESEITPERLQRFFQREEAVYRIRQDLREKVVFAPQNVLQDPPFSKLDIATCRNLLIYLEPEMQQRVLSVLHFGLRDGGTLFLGTSETIGDWATSLFQPIDKKARIYRRIGSSRRTAGHFTVRESHSEVPRGLPPDTRKAAPSLAQLTQRALVDRHIPAAVTIDHLQRVTYFHGDTEKYLTQPRGEATRDLLTLTRESLRGAVRAAVHRASTEQTTVIVRDGVIQTEKGHVRVVVTASPLDPKDPGSLVISFTEHPEPVLAAGAAPGTATEAVEELNRVREELQRTIAELQTSNEELKASNEEVLSINEEMQSTNEELESSKEEMQSLNEELATVNAQLNVKMEELNDTTGDLTSLLMSTDIAVLFLDRDMRIRRFTDRLTQMLDLITTDVGRPLTDMNLKFKDPHLLDDSHAVLAKLVPIEREVTSDDGHSYLRRITPYRTADNKIDGTVIAFIDISDRKKLEEQLRSNQASLSSELRTVNSLRKMTDTLLGAGSIEAALEELLIATIGFHEADMGTVQLRDESTGALKTVMHRGFSGEYLKHHLEPTTGEATFRMLRQGRVVIADITGDAEFEPWREAARIGGYRAMQSTPLTRADGQVIGALSTYFKRPRTFSEAVLAVTELYARQATVVLERLRVEEELRRAVHVQDAARTAFQAAVWMKDDFIATLSHELRTPLSAVLMWAKMLRSGTLSPEQVAEGLKVVEASATVQTRLIDDLLDASRIATGKLRVEMEDADVGATVVSGVEALEPTAAAKGVTLRTEFDPQLGAGMIDAERIRQVVWNLVNNAVKFTPPQGEVVVSVSRHHEEVEIRVRDSGEGIDSEVLPYVFDRFRQANPGRPHMKGLGLGLAISKQLVELHGGTITAESEGLGKGSTFTVRLPLPRVRKTLRSGDDDAAVLNYPLLQGKRILIVEDEAATREVLGAVLKMAGAEVTPADSAKQAIDAFKQQRPDVVLSDIGLPGTTGYELVQQLHELSGKDRVPAVALTAYTQDLDRQKAFDAGFTGFIHKPVGPKQLLGELIRVITMTA